MKLVLFDMGLGGAHNNVRFVGASNTSDDGRWFSWNGNIWQSISEWMPILACRFVVSRAHGGRCVYEGGGGVAVMTLPLTRGMAQSATFSHLHYLTINSWVSTNQRVGQSTPYPGVLVYLTLIVTVSMRWCVDIHNDLWPLILAGTWSTGSVFITYFD